MRKSPPPSRAGVDRPLHPASCRRPGRGAHLIALDRPRAAEAIAARIREAVEGLQQFPERGRVGRVPGTRELVVPRTPFVVPYRVAGQEIQVLAVLHGARAWPPEDGGPASRAQARSRR